MKSLIRLSTKTTDEMEKETSKLFLRAMVNETDRDNYVMVNNQCAIQIRLEENETVKYSDFTIEGVVDAYQTLKKKKLLERVSFHLKS